MRSRVAWLLAGAGIAVALFARFLRRPPVSSAPDRVAPPEPQPDPDPRAGELRRRIAESRDVVDEREVFEEAETPVDQADPDARRRDVHVRGRAALERMRGEPDS
jgi:hypothetical protein